MKTMKSIQEIFTGRFSDARFASIQRCGEQDKNRSAVGDRRTAGTNYTAHWPRISSQTELVGLAIGEGSRKEIWVGRFLQQIPDDGKFGFLVDRFDLIGVHDTHIVGDADFYGKGRGGGPRVNVVRANASSHNPGGTLHLEGMDGQMVQRTVWLRKNHAKFRDPVWRNWGGKCAVTRSDCNLLLVASHINRPLKKCASNGLLAPISKKRAALTCLRSDSDGHFGLFAGHVAHFGRTYPMAHA